MFSDEIRNRRACRAQLSVKSGKFNPRAELTNVFQLMAKLVKSSLCPARRFPGAKPRPFYIASALKDIFGYYLKGKAVYKIKLFFNICIYIGLLVMHFPL